MKKGQTLPAGFNARRTWRTINRYAPADADAFAAAVWRFAETGEARPPESVDPEEWEEAKAETERLKIARNAGKVGGEAGTGENKARPGNQNARKTQAETQAETQATRGRDETKTKTETEPVNPEYENETSVSGFALKVSPADAMRARLLSGEAEAVAVALEWAGETGSAIFRNTLAKRRRELGPEAFTEIVLAKVAEVEAGEKAEHRGKVLNAALRDAAAPETSTPPAPPPREAEQEPVAAPPRETPRATAPEPPRVSVAAILAEAERRGAQTADAVRAVAVDLDAYGSETAAAVREWEERHAAAVEPPPAVAVFASVAEAKRAPVADLSPEELAASQRAAIEGLRRWQEEHPAAATDSTPTPKRETKPARRPRPAPATPPEAQGEPEPPTDSAPGLTPKQARILARVEDACCAIPQEERAVALSYPEEGGATADDAAAVLAAWEAKHAEAV